MRIMYRFSRNHGATAAAEDLETQQKILGRRPRSLDDFVREIAAWKSAVPQAA